jgi:hypothetical protein
MGKCLVCGEKADDISGSLGVSLKCVRRKSERGKLFLFRLHFKTRFQS